MIKLCIRPGTALIFCALLFISQPTYPQTISDTLQFQEIEVVATRIRQPQDYQPTNVEMVDSLRLSLLQAQSVADVLASQSSLMITGNGPGGLATASQRGLSSSQIQVLWEGIPINSSMLGETDLSLLPTSFFSDVQMSSGVPSTAFGGGSLSGALYLGSDWKGGSYVSMKQGAGSYGQWQSSMQGRYQADGWLVSVRGQYDYAENDFSYFNRSNNEVEERRHNRSKRYNVMTSLGKKTESSRWKSTIWIADSDNQIPGNILTSNSQARQEDQLLRWMSTYRKQWNATELSIKNYLDRVELNYFDPNIDTRSLSDTRRWLVSGDVTHAAGDHILLKGELSGELTGVTTNNYTSDKTRRQFSALANPEITLFAQRLRLYPALRLDVYSDFGSVLSPSLGLNYALLPNTLFLRGQLSRDYNPPTFNALYWGRGGNPDLKAEYSRGAEAGLNLRPNFELGISSVNLTAFYNRVDDGIRWYPGNGGVYTPTNVNQVAAMGVEAQAEHYLYLPRNWQLRVDHSLSFNRTEITASRSPGDAAVGSQVRYVPQWKFNSSVTLRKGIAAALLQYRRVSRRFVTDTEDRGSSLDPYQVIDARLQLQKTYFGIHFKARAGVNNIFDENYEIIQWYAMPQRNYNFSITATYQF